VPTLLLRLTLLGGFELGPEGGEPIALPRKKAQALLAYLGLHPSEIQPRDKLAALLWGELSDERARHALRQCLVDLRKALSPLAPSVLVIEPESVRLDADGLEIDVAVFERLVRDGSMAALERAAQLYRGDLLEGLGVREPGLEEWLRDQRERLRELAVEALARLLAHQIRNGAGEPAMQTGLRLLALDPLQEAVHRTLMRLYAGLGRRGAALRQYQVCVDLLQRELGVEPETETGRLYQEILQTPSALPSVAPAPRWTPSAPSVAGTSFVVGRDSELERLRSACDDAWGGRAAVVLLSGEAGIGKTRLIDALVAEVLGRGGRALVGRAHESEQILPFGVWSDALRAGGVVSELREQPATESAWRRDLEWLLPELATGERSDAIAEDHIRLFEALTRAVEHAASAQPVVLVLEDLHWADEMSLRAFAHISRRAAGWRVLLVGTARPEEMIDAPALRRLVGELGRPGDLIALTLSRLSAQDTLALVAALARSGTASETIERLNGPIWRASEGNPFMVVETMRALGDRGELSELPADLSTPPRVRDLVMSRLARLGGPARELAAVASVVGREFDFELLRHAAGMTGPEAAAGVEELVTRRILGVMGERLDFTHDQIRTVTYAALLRPRRRLLHAAVAEALELIFGDDLDAHALALAVHSREAERWDPAFDYFTQAGYAALVRGAHREALASFDAALALSDRLPTTRETVERTIDARFDLRQAAAPLFEYRRIIGELRAAEEVARGIGDTSRAGWALAYQCHALYVIGDRHAARAAGEQALEIATALDDVRLHIATRVYLGFLCVWLGEYRRGVELLRQNVHRFEERLSRSGGAIAQQPYSRVWLAACLAELGHFDEAEALADDALRISEARDSAYALLHASWVRGYVTLRRGDVARAVPAFERGLEVCRRLELPFYSSLLAAGLAHAYTFSGRVDEALGLLEDTMAAVREIGGWTALPALLAEAYLQAGRLAEARPLAEEAVRLTSERGERGFEAWAHRLVADILTKSGPAATETAADEYRRAMALAGELGMRPLVALCHRGLGLLWGRAGQVIEGRAELEMARGLFKELGMTTWYQQTEGNLAEFSVDPRC
jgi:DNA-binding SARP family transcriptional activator/tetratricopeptide (TPR) repeat protein